MAAAKLPQISECKIHKRRKKPMRSSDWENGHRFMSHDDHFNLHVGGNVQWESVWLGDSNGNLAEPGSNGHFNGFGVRAAIDF